MDKIERVLYSGNEIFAFTRLEDRYSIYRGKGVNREKAQAETIALIHSAKKFSETTGSALIMDFSKDLDSPTIVRPHDKNMNSFSRIGI
ncbi:hypothetical protein [Methanosarcina sp. 2.H.A.1B.4]|uniref:hypothetical protein n=1 Tax=Methanosarcina sp. 2.H.A.1B.4 TaxID=1483600 RepID=UPI0012E09F4D|nr:hypothetical protein [Methanosarcina sp. 2.H.A.1B.4]